MSLLTMETVPASPRVVEALESTRQSMRRYRMVMALVGVALTMIAVAVVVAVADVAWVLPFWVRAFFLVAVVLTSITAIGRAVISPRQRYGRDDAAAEVESAFPELGQRVRTTLEYSEPTPTTAPASRSLVGAMVADTERQTRGLEFPAVVPWSSFTRRAMGLTAAVVGVLIALAYDPTLRIAAARLLLRPVHYTNLTVEPGDRTIKEGTDFALRATLTGRPVAEARWLRRPVGSQEVWSAVSLAPALAPGDRDRPRPRPRPLTGLLEAVRKDCRADFEYRVTAGEVESDIYRVTVTHPLNLKSFQATIEPPFYTRLKPSVAREGNFQVPEGSKVRFQIALDRTPLSARISWSPTEGEGSKTSRTMPLAIEGNKLSGEWPALDKDIRYEVIASAADGMKLDSSRFTIQVKADEKPTVRFVKPPETLAVIPTTEVPMKVEAGDDYGIARVGIAFQIGDGPEESLYLDNPKDQPPSVEALATLYLEKYKLTYTEALTYHAFVEDNRAGSPHRVSTDLRYIDILPYKQTFQLVEGGGTCNGSSVTLEELILRQRMNLNRTFAHEDDRPVEAKVADRLSKTEAELALATGEFAQKLASEFGPISPLEEATQAMESATVALASRDVVTALLQERTALAALIRARQNLKKLLSTSPSSSQCRKIDRQQNQKIRKPPAANKSKEAELARLEQDIKKLAEEQKKFSEEVNPKSSGASLDPKDAPKDGKPSKGTGSKPGPAERQQASAREAERLQTLARKDQAMTDLARARMDEATREVKDAEGSIRADKPGEAAEAARSAAEHLERLAEQVAGLKAKEMAARLAKARDLAQATAKAERESAGKAREGRSGEADEAVAEQLGLAERTRTLADLLKEFRANAVEEDRPLAQAVAKATAANPPSEIEQAMRQATAALASGEGSKSGKAMEEAAGRLDALARDLETARRDHMQPKLQQLLAAEKKAAEARKALESAADAAQKAEAENKMSDLARAVEGLKPAEGPLRKAADSLAQATQMGGTSGWTPPKKIGDRTGLFTPPISYTNAVREISQALQARIQELILDDALLDRDGPVPPGYKEMVEDYFRVLSEDLR